MNREMRWSKSYLKKKKKFLFLLVSVIVVYAFQETQTIKYFQSCTIDKKASYTIAYAIKFKDSIPSDTLFQLRSKEDIPISYYRKVNTGICFDNKCRILNIVLYWNITGRYLGFELPEQEFLSKTEHEPFTTQEYEKLNEILANTNSPLAQFSYKQLVLAPPTNINSVDAVSSATSPAVIDHVVQGAVYTTYMLYQTIYGTTQIEVQKKTKKDLTPEIILEILYSSDSNDKMWVLNAMNPNTELSPKLLEKLLSFITNDNYSLAERSLHVIQPEEFNSETLQLQLLEKFSKAGYSLKKLIVDKLSQAPNLSDNTLNVLAGNIKNMNGEIQHRVLNLFQQHQISNPDILLEVAVLLESDNNFISNKAFVFLKKHRANKQIGRLLEVYERKRN